MDLKTAIQTGDAGTLRTLLQEDRTRAHQLIEWGELHRCFTHPLHFVSDMVFEGKIHRDVSVALVDALIEAGAASLGAEEVGIRLVEAGADPAIRGLFGETALHWAALLGEDRLAAKLIGGSDLNLKDSKYESSPLGWAIHGSRKPPKGNYGRQREVVELLVAAGAVSGPD